MNDQQLFEDLLSSIKGTCDLYMHGTIESATSNVHTTFNDVLFKSLEMQKDLYNKMTAEGWYTNKPVEQQKIKTTKQKILNT